MSARRSRGQSPRPPRGGRGRCEQKVANFAPRRTGGRRPLKPWTRCQPAPVPQRPHGLRHRKSRPAGRSRPTAVLLTDDRPSGFAVCREPAGSQLWPRRAYDHPALNAARHLSLKASPRRAQAQLSDEVLDTANEATGQRTSSASVLPDRSADRWSHAGRAWVVDRARSARPSVVELRHWSEFTRESPSATGSVHRTCTGFAVRPGTRAHRTDTVERMPRSDGTSWTRSHCLESRSTNSTL